MNNTCSRPHFQSSNRIKEKNYKKLSKPFTLLVLVCLLKNVFFDDCPGPCGIKSNKKQMVFIIPVGVSRQK